jgi:hypothetical protein
MKEIWINIKGYENKYQISNYGRIKSLKNLHRTYREKILKNLENPQGYYFVILYFGKIQKTKLVSRLVAQAFIPNPENKPQVNHIDGNKKNNYISNLEWVTAFENRNHAYKIGLINNSGEKNGNSKFNNKEILLIRETYKNNNYTYKKIAEIFNISNSHAWNIINKKMWIYI